MILRRRTMLQFSRGRWLLFALGVCILGFFGVSQVMSSSSVSNNNNMETTTTSPTFSLLVTVIFQKEEYKNEFLRDFHPLAQYVRQREPSTIAYEVLESDSDPLRVLILERYQDKENAYLSIHKSSAAFLKFRPKLKAMQEAGYVTTIEGHSYQDSLLGFVGRGT